ncbi:MAG: hypothetical protein PHX74_12690 [Candidatus Sumerlaeales bacterium]|nr:hypothetical protein [Candidatus Sumerlaeales bacterium]
MNKQSEYICPICGKDSLCTDFTDGMKWGRAYCVSCDCGGPEVRTGYEENLDAPWRTEARKQFVEVVNEHAALRGPQPDPETGLMKCGCGGIPEFREDKTEPKFGIYTVMCSKCNIRLSGYTNRIDFLKIDWNRAMGWRDDK